MERGCVDIPNLLSEPFRLQGAIRVELHWMVPNDIVDLIRKKACARIQLLCLCEGRGGYGKRRNALNERRMVDKDEHVLEMRRQHKWGRQ